MVLRSNLDLVITPSNDKFTIRLDDGSANPLGQFFRRVRSWVEKIPWLGKRLARIGLGSRSKNYKEYLIPVNVTNRGVDDFQARARIVAHSDALTANPQFIDEISQYVRQRDVDGIVDTAGKFTRARDVIQSREKWAQVMEPERKIERSQTVCYEVNFKVPLDVEPASYEFSLDVIDAEYPDDVYVGGRHFFLDIEGPLQKQRVFPWWVVWVLAVLAAVVGGAALLVMMPPARTMPDLTGKPFEEASRELHSRGLKLASLQWEWSLAEISRTKVITFQPAVGTPITAGQAVTLTLSRPALVMPAVNHMHRGQAYAALSRLCNGGPCMNIRIMYQDISRQEIESSMLGRVLGSNPPAGQLIVPTSTVVLTVASGAPLTYSLAADFSCFWDSGVKYDHRDCKSVYASLYAYRDRSDLTGTFVLHFLNPGLPAGAVVSGVKLRLYLEDFISSDEYLKGVTVSGIKIPWNPESQSEPICDGEGVTVTTWIKSPAPQVYEWDLSNLSYGFAQAEGAVFCVQFVSENRDGVLPAGFVLQRFATVNHFDPTHRPQLSIEYYVPGAVEQSNAPEGSGN